MSYLQIDLDRDTPVYTQIMDAVRRLVRQGQLAPGAPLPSVRQLAADLEVNRNTVARAYWLLEREGIVETAGRRGTCVAGAARDQAERAVAQRLAEFVERIVGEARSAGIEAGEVAEALSRHAATGASTRRRRKAGRLS